VVGNDSLWYTPPKPLSNLRTGGLLLYSRSWAGLEPGTSRQVPVTVLVPCGPQQQQQQRRQQQQQRRRQQKQQQKQEGEDKEEEEAPVVVPYVGHDMPGEWQMVCSTTGSLSCNIASHMKFFSATLFQQLEPLAADHFLLRAQYDQVRAACAGL
jgi:hypothetical protein